MALSEEAKMLSALVHQRELNQLKRVVGTPRVGEVLRKICRRAGLQNNLIVHSALIELAVKKGH